MKTFLMNHFWIFREHVPILYFDFRSGIFRKWFLISISVSDFQQNIIRFRFRDSILEKYRVTSTRNSMETQSQIMPTNYFASLSDSHVPQLLTKFRLISWNGFVQVVTVTVFMPMSHYMIIRVWFYYRYYQARLHSQCNWSALSGAPSCVCRAAPSRLARPWSLRWRAARTLVIAE